MKDRMMLKADDIIEARVQIFGDRYKSVLHDHRGPRHGDPALPKERELMREDAEPAFFIFACCLELDVLGKQEKNACSLLTWGPHGVGALPPKQLKPVTWRQW
jgi:hypothetical protein